MRGVPRSHNGNCQLVAREPIASAKNQSWWIGDLMQKPRILRIRFGDDRDLVGTTDLNLSIDIDFLRRVSNALAEVRSHTSHLPQLFGRCCQDRFRVSKPFE